MSQWIGAALWLVSGTAAFLLARAVPRRRRGLLPEGLAALAVTVFCGLLATVLDFGGWAEPDWRALLFVFLGVLSVTGLLRIPGVK